MARFWCPHQEEAWVPASLVNSSGDKHSFVFNDGKKEEALTFPSTEASKFSPVEPDQEHGADDVCAISTVNEGIMLHTCRVRYAKHIIYTRVARALIAVNPFKALPIYDAAHMERYHACADSLDEPPHIFGISQDALQGIRNSPKDQAVLVSGESGAGKTESAKLILSFVADAVRSEEGGIEDRVCQTNPVLEAFGNAMTVRNNNSSRFGKWLDLRVAVNGPLAITGCTLTSYLLETIRVTQQSPDERGFHIFFQVLQARNSPFLKDLGLEAPKSYRYLKDGQLVAPGVDDAENFEELKEAMSQLEFNDESQKLVFRILAGILYLGNVEFIADGHDSCKISDDVVVKKVADFLQVDSEKLAHCLRFKLLVVGKDVTEQSLRLDQSQAAREGLTRLLYGRLFLWLIKKMNEQLKLSEVSGQERLLGVLDIAGFESFEKNSLEQLMINLSNEHLQQHFIQIIFKEELDDAAKEGIELAGEISFSDNSDVLAFIDGKGSILDILDETMAMPKADDMTYVTKVLKQQEKHPRLIAPKFAKTQFTVKHYAGNVAYSCEGWLEKNADKPPDAIAQLMTASGNFIVKELGDEMMVEEAEKADAPRGAKAKKVKSVTSGFRTSLRSLMQKIHNATPHYIRCIKPNMQKVPDKFTSKMVLEQMILSGTFATVQIRQQGYAYRLLHKHFMMSYRCIADKLGKKKLPSAGKDATNEQVKGLCQELVSALPEALPSFGDLGSKMFQVGKTKVFIKLDAFKAIEDGRRHALGGVVLHIQRIARGMLARRELKPRKELHKDIRAMLQKLKVTTSIETGKDANGRRKSMRRSSAWPGESLFSVLGSEKDMHKAQFDIELLLGRADALCLQNSETLKAESTKRRLGLELESLQELENLQTCVDVIDIEKAVARARSLQLLGADAAEKLEERLANLTIQLPLITQMEAALSGTEQVGEDDLKDIVDQCEQKGLQSGSSEWLPELKGAELIVAITKRLGEVAEERRKSEAESRKSAADETPKRLRNKTQSVGGLDQAEQDQIKSQLRKAAKEFDCAALEKLLRKAVNIGLKDDDGPEDGHGDDDEDNDGSDTTSGPIAHAQNVLDKLQSEFFLLGAMCDAQAAAAVPEPPLLALKQLDNLSRQLYKMPGYEDEAKDATHSAVSGLVKSSNRSGMTLSVFNTGDAAELELATGVFSAFSNFSRLKPVKGWLGHTPMIASVDPRRSMAVSNAPTLRLSTRPGAQLQVGGTGGGKLGKPEGHMLSHSKSCIYESMTQVPDGADSDEYEGGAVLNFRNILVSMGDRPSQRCQRSASSNAVVDLARNDLHLRDEVYAQVLKQLNGNRSGRSVTLGFELLLRLCQSASPSAELADFIRAFVNAEETQQGIGDSAGIAKACLMALDAPPEQQVQVLDSETAELATMAEMVSRRLDDASTKLSMEVFRLSQECAGKTQEIERLTFEKGKQSAEIAAISQRANAVATHLGKAAGFLENKITSLTEENKKQAEEIKRLSLLLEKNGVAIEEKNGKASSP